jgi:hypothetical protein
MYLVLFVFFGPGIIPISMIENRDRLTVFQYMADELVTERPLKRFGAAYWCLSHRVTRWL